MKRLSFVVALLPLLILVSGVPAQTQATTQQTVAPAARINVTGT
jgi:hypothetical protein